MNFIATSITLSIAKITRAKITEATYDSLLERWDKLIIGDARITVADVILNRKRYVK